MNRALLAAAIALALAACSSDKTDTATTAKPAANAGTSAADADKFVADLNDKRKARYSELTAAQWVSETYINGDSQLIAAKANERELAETKAEIDAAKKFEASATKPDTRRGILLLKLSTPLPAPKDRAKLAEMTTLAAKLDGEYGAAKWCKDEKDPKTCLDIGKIEEILQDKKRDYQAQLDAWQGWSDQASVMRNDYKRLVELVNEGSRELGYKDTGEFWRAGYDMSPAEFSAETDRLWGQVKPMYEQLQCYARKKLVDKYGDKGQIDGMIPAHLTGNLWAQTWGEIWDILQPYPAASNLDYNAALKSERDAEYKALLAAAKGAPDALAIAELNKQADLAFAKKTVHRTEDFYRSIGFPALPASFYEKSQLIKPEDRDVVCHASAWDMDTKGDLRLKMCIKPLEDDFRTVYHEMGHIYYDVAYNPLPILFQNAAHDGFHEAIGDTIQLSLTPGYLHQIGLVGDVKESKEALINKQMKLALEKVAFLPFGLLIDRWRWGVFSGEIKPEDYNKAWWDLRAKYQGVAPAVARGEDRFDPGAKYHVPGNVPYTRYFLADILQFQFQRELCKAAGHQGQLADCSIYGNKEAGAKYWAMLQKGASQPWPATLKELTGSEQMDASAILDYFAPLNEWLKEQNKDQKCGWGA